MVVVIKRKLISALLPSPPCWVPSHHSLVIRCKSVRVAPRRAFEMMDGTTSDVCRKRFLVARIDGLTGTIHDRYLIYIEVILPGRDRRIKEVLTLVDIADRKKFGTHTFTKIIRLTSDILSHHQKRQMGRVISLPLTRLIQGPAQAPLFVWRFLMLERSCFWPFARARKHWSQSTDGHRP